MKYFSTPYAPLTLRNLTLEELIIIVEKVADSFDDGRVHSRWPGTVVCHNNVVNNVSDIGCEIA